MRTLSLIFPCYNKQENIGILYERVCETINELKQYEFELIFVNDCSSDETFGKLNAVCEKDSRVKITQFCYLCFRVLEWKIYNIFQILFMKL